MEELGASEAQKTEILNYEVLIILKANNIFFVKIWVNFYCNIARILILKLS